MSRDPRVGRRAPPRGFTLMELLATLAILAALATLVVPLAKVQLQRQKEQQLRIALREIRDAIDAYKAAWDKNWIAHAAGSNGYPPTLEALCKGVADLRSQAGARLYFIRRIPRDPFAEDASASDGETWRLRSYESPPDEPRPGDDVYDVSSRSDVVGLNGQVYSQW